MMKFISKDDNIIVYDHETGEDNLKNNNNVSDNDKDNNTNKNLSSNYNINFRDISYEYINPIKY